MDFYLIFYKTFVHFTDLFLRLYAKFGFCTYV